MICPHCNEEINHVDVRSHCYQRGTLVEEDGKFFITDYNKLDVFDTEAIECPKCSGALMHVVGEGSPLEDGDITSVDLMPSGYEWNCPACMHVNNLLAAPIGRVVRCAQCSIEFEVNEMKHCIEE